MTKILSLYVVVLALAYACNAAKVLVVFIAPGKSHSILAEGYVRLLTEAGHEVTYMTYIQPSKPYKNLRVVDISRGLGPLVDLVFSKTNITAILNKEHDNSPGAEMFSLFPKLGRAVLEDENAQKFLNDPNETFDVIITEWLFLDIFAGLQAVFKCPLIWSSPTEPHSTVTKLIDEPLNPAYTADLFSSESPPFSFLGRVQELFRLVATSVLNQYYIVDAENQVYEEVIVPIAKKRGNLNPPSFTTLMYNASMMLGNSHVSLGQPCRLPQNYKPIAGYHIDTNVQPLPEDLKQTFDTATNGVIYFSMGSAIKSKDLPDVLKKDLLKLFSELKYTVVWKFEDVMPNLPKNVHILQWAPQQSILAHPNCKLFITHGGLLSTTEAVHFGVPVIGIPVFADQFINIKRTEDRGFGIKVDLSYSLAEDLKKAIGDIFASPKYGEKVKELSMIYHDRPVPPGKELVHWVEHVVKTKGAAHLRSPALHVPWYQKVYLDLALVLLTGLIVAVHLIKSLCKRLFGKNKVLKDKKIN